MTRRDFTRAIAAGTWAAGISFGATDRLKIGIGTFTYHSLSMDDMIVQLRALDIQEIEMSRGEYMLMEHPPATLFESARKKLDAGGIRCVSYYTATIKDDADLTNALRFAKILGCSNVSGDATGPILKTLDQRFTDSGLTFGIHNHWFKQKFAYESVDDVLNALASLSGTVGSTLDVGQMVACGHDPVDAVRRLAPRLKMVHLKDVQGPGAEVNVPLGQGAVNIPAVMKELKAQNYRGLVAIEYEHEGDVNEDVRRQVAFARAHA